MTSSNLTDLPPDLPRPTDDGACDHLPGLAVPHVALRSTAGRDVDLAALSGTTVVYFYPMTGTPGTPLPDGWDAIPGARGCTPQACSFRDHAAELAAAGATVFGVSFQTPAEQAEAAGRLHLPFELLSDRELTLATALRLPTFDVAACTMIRRLTLIVENGVIAKVFYPVFPPDRNVIDVIEWLSDRA